MSRSLTHGEHYLYFFMCTFLINLFTSEDFDWTQEYSRRYMYDGG